MSLLSKMSNSELIDACITLDKQIKDAKRKSDSYKAELQSRAITIMEDKNIRFVKFYGQNSFASINDNMKLEVLNMERLKTLFGSGVIKEQVTESEEIKYKWKVKFEKLLKVIFNGDYTFELTLEEFLDTMSIVPDQKQKKLLLKHLKGDYEKDKGILYTDLGLCDKDEDWQKKAGLPDMDVELYYIYKIKNGELLKAFLPEEGIDNLIKEIRKCILVETSTAIKVDYEQSEEESA